MGAPSDLKATINLPKTDFSMKANLPQNEPKMLARWEEMRIYERIRESRKGAPIYLLHDGREAAVIDPGVAAPVEAYLLAHKLRLTSMLLTHSHTDHTAGVPALPCRGYP